MYSGVVPAPRLVAPWIILSCKALDLFLVIFQAPFQIGNNGIESTCFLFLCHWFASEQTKEVKRETLLSDSLISRKLRDNFRP